MAYPPLRAPSTALAVSAFPDEHALRQLILDNADGIIVVEPGGSVLFANAAAIHLFRPAGEGLVGTEFGRPTVVGELTEIDIPATASVAQMRVAAIEWEGAPALLASLRDITERRLAEKTRSQLAAIVESSDDAIIGLSASGAVESWNAGAQRLYRYTPEEAIGHPIFDLIAPDQAEDRQRMVRRVLSGGRVEQLDTRDHRKDGSAVDVSITDSPIRDASGEVIGVARIARDVTARKRMERELKFYADHDALTGLFNRRRLGEELAHQCARTARYDETSALLVGDIDNFKLVNDSLGHKAGDQLLKGVAEAMSSRLRTTDLLARLGGDEFAVLLPRTDLDSAHATADSLRTAVGALTTIFEGQALRVTISFGITGIEGALVSPDDALAIADLAMYEAKHQGRNRIMTARASLERQRAEKILSWSERLRNALDEERFEFYVQPIVDLATGTTDRCELLLRMHENGNVILPDAFIHTAERYGLIAEIDRWVVSQALALVDSDSENMTYSVNLSGGSMGDQQLLALIEKGIRDRGIDPSRLIFEVTETVAIADIDAARHFTDALHRAGCTAALDDFGSGFGSFYYLKYLPIDYVKIDGDFVRQLPDNKSDCLLVKAIVDVARGLGKRTIAEHVSSEQAMVLLREYGVDYGQGFHLGHPAPLACTRRVHRH
jgi:diguanylate cyclase (GGDEF)-like protein/PAS domain S-box-containing protein